MNKISNKLDIVLPVFHEEENVRPLIEGILKNVKTPCVITAVIQDPKDPSIEILKKMQNKTNNLKILFTKNGTGMLKAIKAGIEATSSPLIILTMADLSDDPVDIDRIVEKLENGYDLVCGSRYMKGGRHIGGPLVKNFLSYAGCKTLRLFTGIPTNDATNAFKGFKRKVFEKIEIESKEGFELPLELTVKAFRQGFNITEIPTTWKDREKGKSKFKIWKNIKYYLRWYFYALS
jgi:glycosyltransferase involved in cell wall biosynthesis